MAFKLFWSLKKRLYRLTGTSPRVARRLGALWLLDPADWLDLQILIGRPFETDQMARLASLCREHGVTRFVDCGANIGFYSILLPRSVPGLARVDAFEPVASARWRLVANLGLNGLYPWVRVHAVALGDRDGEMQIAIDPSSTGISSLSPSPEERANRGFARQETVRSVRLDDHLAGLSGAVAFKIDVEGHEPALLAGMAETLRRAFCVVQIEARPRNRRAVEAFFGERGYRRLDAIGDDLFFVPVPARPRAAAGPAVEGAEGARASTAMASGAAREG